MNLPESYLNKMKEILGDEYSAFIESFNEKSLNGLRVNTNKISVEEFEKIAPYSITRIPYIDNGFFIDDKDEWSKHPYYYAGLYYLQEPSAMLPANRLPVTCDDYVLDLCAAPGGKSTELASKNPKLLVSNDISYKRAIPLVKNLEIAGACNVAVTCEDPSKLSIYYGEFFDKILVDAPCSGEGMFRRDSDLIKAYEDRKPEDYTDIQKHILSEAYKMCKPGGYIMYSTCTFSDLEDESVIYDFILNHDDITIEDIKHYDGFAKGYNKYSDMDKDLSKCVHVFPHKMQGEGHFMTLMKKANKNAIKYDSPCLVKNKRLVSYDKLNNELKLFLDCFEDDNFFDFKNRHYLLGEDDMIFMLPNGEVDLLKQGIRYLRTGILLGRASDKKGFTPHTAMALAKGSECFNNFIDFDLEDDFVIKYLKGETLIVSEDKLAGIRKGICMIKVDGFPIGFAKFDGQKFKNLYEKGWRLS